MNYNKFNCTLFWGLLKPQRDLYNLLRAAHWTETDYGLSVGRLKLSSPEDKVNVRTYVVLKGSYWWHTAQRRDRFCCCCFLALMKTPFRILLHLTWSKNSSSSSPNINCKCSLQWNQLYSPALADASRWLSHANEGSCPLTTLGAFSSPTTADDDDLFVMFYIQQIHTKLYLQPFSIFTQVQLVVCQSV